MRQKAIYRNPQPQTISSPPPLSALQLRSALARSLEASRAAALAAALSTWRPRRHATVPGALKVKMVDPKASKNEWNKGHVGFQMYNNNM